MRTNRLPIGNGTFWLFILTRITVFSALEHNVCLLSDHKTGTVLMSNIANCLGAVYHSHVYNLEDFLTDNSKLPKKNQWNSQQIEPVEIGKRVIQKNAIFTSWHSKSFVELEEMLRPYRAIVITRHPLDRILSGCRYHKESSERWLHEEGWLVHLYEQHGYNTSYMTNTNTIHELYKPLDSTSAILFEMKLNLYDYEIRGVNSTSSHLHELGDANVFTIRMEKFRTDLDETLRSIAHHTGLDLKAVTECGNKAGSGGHHATTPQNLKAALLLSDYEFPMAKLKCIHFLYFEKMQGVDAITLHGYEDSLPVYYEARTKACEGYDEAHPVYPYFDPVYGIPD
jgi:hypothetical protein